MEKQMTNDSLLDMFSEFEIQDSEKKLTLGGWVYRFFTDTGIFFEEYNDATGEYVTAYNFAGRDIGTIPCEENYV